jgi:hypothetical protein
MVTSCSITAATHNGRTGRDTGHYVRCTLPDIGFPLVKVAPLGLSSDSRRYIGEAWAKSGLSSSTLGCVINLHCVLPLPVSLEIDAWLARRI